jgi:phospholipid-binding lipoprotein MlaA
MNGTVVVLSLTVFAAGCATVPNKGEHDGEAAQEQADGHDPWEKLNRSIYRFNDAVDRAVIKPLAKGYRRITPRPVRRSVGNFFRNLLEPTTVVNDLLQGKPLQAMSDTSRLLLNSTLGIAGLFDVATKIGVERNQEDFGQTLAVWGISPGPYVVLPFIGPSNVRDAFGLLPYYYYTDPRLALDEIEARVALIAIDVIDFRSQLLGATKLLDMQLDPYLFSRESYRQKRLDLIYDGDPPLDESSL